MTDAELRNGLLAALDALDPGLADEDYIELFNCDVHEYPLSRAILAFRDATPTEESFP